MKNRLRLLAASAALLLPLSAVAEPPSYVTGLRAEVVNGEVHMSWTPVSNQDVAFYRVYYSFESILENDGLFDDYEETQDSTPTHVIEDPPPVQTIFVAVIAVNSANESADMFVEEIAVSLTGQQVGAPGTTREEEREEEEVLRVRDETLTAPVEREPDMELPPEAHTPPEIEATRLAVLSAQAVSPTAVLVRFSASVLVATEDAPKAFSITDDTGEVLPIVRMVIEGPSAVVTTANQRPRHPYTFHMREPAYNPDGLALDADQASAEFTGHPTAIHPADEPAYFPDVHPADEPVVPSVPAEPTAMTVQGIENLSLTAQKQGNGLYTITARWDLVGDVDTLKQYLIYQTRDGGQTFGQPDTLQPGIAGVTIPNVTPGSFGIAVALVLLDGTMIQGAVDSVMLEGAIVAPPTAQIITPPDSDLSRTGVGALALSLVCAGAAAGVHGMKKRRS